MRTSTSSRNGPAAPERVREPISSWSNAASTAMCRPCPTVSASRARALSPACTEDRLSSRPEANSVPPCPNTAGGCESASTTS
jgi:hypothetical protein